MSHPARHHRVISRESDFIDFVIALARADDPGKPLDFWLRPARRWRDRWGGRRHFIAKQSSVDRAGRDDRQRRARVWRPGE